MCRGWHPWPALLIAALAIFPGAAPGESLSGSVTDRDKLPIPGVTVTVENIGTSERRAVTTDPAGAWEVRLLPPGLYRIRFEAPGFRTRIFQPVPVPGRSSKIDARMTPGAGTEGGVPERIEALPSSSRNFSQLAVIRPGVSADISELVSNDNATIVPSVDGARSTNNSFVFNGIDVGNLGPGGEGEKSASRTMAPAPETLAEVKLETGVYDAANGRSGGGNFRLVSKSGTNEFHGTVYHFFQNEKLIANDYFFNRAGRERPMLRRNEGGATAGGPIVKNKTFFFGSYQATRAKTALVDEASNTVRMPRDLTDDRSDEGINRFARALGVEQIADINPTSRRLLKARFPDGTYLIPSGANGLNCEQDSTAESCQVLRIVPATFEQDQFTIHIDHRLNQANKFSGSFFYTDQPSRDPLASSSALSYLEQSRQSGQRVFSATDVHIFGSSVVNEFRAGFFRSRNDILPIAYFTNLEFGITNPVASIVPDLARIDIRPRDAGERFRFGTLDESNLEVQHILSAADTLSLVKGKHSVRIGGEIRRTRLDAELQKSLNLSYELRSWFDFLTVGKLDSKGRVRQFKDIDFNYSESSGAFRANDYNLFLAEDWKVAPSLTLHLGLRYEYNGFPSEIKGRLANYDFATAMATGNIEDGFVFASNFQETTIPGAAEVRIRRAGNRTALQRDWNNFAPRFGFAWSAPGLGNLTLRGGYGIFYERVSGALARARLESFPFLRELEVHEVGDWNATPPDRPPFPISALTVAFHGGQPQLESVDAPGTPFAPVEVYTVDPQLATPYIQHWSLTMKWKFRKDYVFEIGYVGTKGTKLLQTANVNQALDLDEQKLLTRPGVPGGGFTTNYFDIVEERFVPAATPPCNVFSDPQDCTIPAELRGPLLGFAADDGVNMSYSNANSIYNGLQLSVQKRHSRGHTFNLNYTFSKSIDTYSREGTSAGQHDQRKLFLNRGLSDFDQKHRLTASWTWELPLGGKRWLEGWSFSGIATLQSGQPFTIVDTEYSGFLYDSSEPRPSAAPGATHHDIATRGPVTSRVDGYLDPEALVHSAAQFGSLGRNTVRGPDQRRVDFVGSKQTRISERISLEFRAEFFNAFNTVTFRPPADDFAQPGFGQITRTRGGPRVIQFGLKLRF